MRWRPRRATQRPQGRLDVRSATPNHGGAGAPPLRAVLVESPDPSGRRWQTALDLLLEAGREAQEAMPTR